MRVRESNEDVFCPCPHYCIYVDYIMINAWDELDIQFKLIAVQIGFGLKKYK